jgi:hypothetical protein
MSSTLIPVVVAITTVTTPLPASNAAQASISIVVTDSTGAAQSAVLLNGNETPTPWAFTTSVNPGAGTVTATALDTAGATIGTPLTSSFTVTPQAVFQAPSAITVSAQTSSVASAAAHVAAARK